MAGEGTLPLPNTGPMALGVELFTGPEDIEDV